MKVVMSIDSHRLCMGPEQYGENVQFGKASRVHFVVLYVRGKVQKGVVIFDVLHILTVCDEVGVQ